MNQYGVFNSQEMQNIYKLAKRYALFPTTVLIEGETGVGKEIIANLIHKSSPRSNKPFIKVNCGAIPESLIESELFGYESGSFTGAKPKGNAGLFESAHEGSLLLDEVGELSKSLQVKLLRVLQEHEVRRIGGSWSKSIDVRIIACTNSNLLDSVKCGKFRKDLFYRFNVAKISIPPLRERKKDILPLAEYFLEEFCERYKFDKFFNKAALKLIYNHEFEGNVRELKNIVESAYITAEKNEITVNDLPKNLIDSKPVLNNINCEISEDMTSLPDILNMYEKKIITEALSTTSSIRSAARMLGISNSTLLRRIKSYELEGILNENV